MIIRPFLSALLLSTTMLGACAIQEPYARPAVSSAAQWNDKIATTDAIDATWWNHFNDKTLNQLIAQAQQNNNDLGASLARIDQARAQIRIAQSALFPNANASGSVNTSNTNRTSSADSVQGGASISYEMDLWGKNRNTTEAARKRLTASQYDKDALALVVASDTADAYFTILTYLQRIYNAEQNLGLSRDVARVINDRHSAGAASGQDIAQQNTAIASAEANLSTLRRQLTNAQNSLHILLGQAPQNTLALPVVSADAQPLNAITVPVVAPLQPASLLERRPDIRSLEESLKATNIDIAIARANFFPTLSLGAGLTAGANPISGPVSLGTNLAGSLAAPLFTAGRLEGQLDLSNARKRELAENYKGAVLNAFREGEDSLAAVKAASERVVSLATAHDESRRYYTIARERYLNGADDFLTLLDAQRTLIQSEDQYSQAQLEQLQAVLSLYKAMGGGWRQN
jgi:multidrug efflux system outer membrane protein